MTPEMQRAEAVLRVAENRTLSRKVRLEIVAHHLAQMRDAPANRRGKSTHARGAEVEHAEARAQLNGRSG